MSSEFKGIIAFLFKKIGKNKIPQSELILTLSMDLKWFSPKTAKNFIDLAIKKSIIVEKNNFLIPKFNINSEFLPLNYSPNEELLFSQIEVNKNNNLNKTIDSLLQELQKKTDKNLHEIINKIKELEKSKEIIFEIAALLVCLDYDINLIEFLDKFENIIYK